MSGLSQIVVAMDGPSGAGKSSVSRGVASALGLRYLDTGAMYRAITCWMLRQGVDVEDADGVAARAGEPVLEISTEPGAVVVTLDGEDVSEPIRSEAVTAAVSAVASVPEVRERMVAHQRRVIGDGGIVVEGRDIGSTVCPDAAAKVYLTARPEIRARRRAAEVADTEATDVSEDAVADNIAAMAVRDVRDLTRNTSPLKRADGATEVDASDLTLDEVIALVVSLVREAESASAS